MLIPNIIPSTEPNIRVGIILPEDQQTDVTLQTGNTVNIWGDNTEIKFTGSKQLTVRKDGNYLRLVNSNLHAACTKIVLDPVYPLDGIKVHPVVAGRGFHWKKKIEVELSHRIEMMVLDGNLILINELPLEHYLACVATSEMSAACPEHFISAQVITARSWMLANVEQKHVKLGMDVCNDDCCQRYQGMKNITPTAFSTALKTRGQVLVFDHKICDARYSKSCGGVMETFENLWNGNPLPYLKNKIDGSDSEWPDLTAESGLYEWVRSNPATYCSPAYIMENSLKKYLGDVDEEGNYFRWKVRISQQNLTNNLNEKLGLNAKAITELTVISRGGSGRILKLEIDYLSTDGSLKKQMVEKDYEVRRILHPSFLYSSACIIESVGNDEIFPDFEYTGAGWGHGAGLCQIGALGMALNGFRYKDILDHYYPGAELKQIYA